MARARRETANSSPELVAPPVDQAIARLVRPQHGVVSRAQLRSIGLADHEIAYRLRTGRLHRLHRGVYAVGHTVLAVRGRWMAAVLACGDGAALSHPDAVALWDMGHIPAGAIHVSVPRAGGQGHPGIRIHRSPGLRPDETIEHDGIRTTTAARTILDMAALLSPSRLESLLDRAERQELTDYAALNAIARAHPTHRGAARLTRALESHYAGDGMTRSELEVAFLELCRAHGLPRPRVNAHVEGLEVDFLFPAARLVVETDGWRFHKTRRDFERDRARDARLPAAGYGVLRFTDRQIADRPASVAAAIRGATGRPGGGP